MIAVIMSTYNGEKYLPQQLDSVLRQTLEDFILIIRDDGSSDGTVPLLRGYTDERIVLLEGENVGPCRSFPSCCRRLRAAAHSRFTSVIRTMCGCRISSRGWSRCFGRPMCRSWYFPIFR